MIHILWGAMIIIGIVYGILFGNGDVLGTAAINRSEERRVGKEC